MLRGRLSQTPGAAAGASPETVLAELRSLAGPGVSEAIARELGLELKPCQALSAETLEQVFDMGATAMCAMEGVEFVDRLLRRPRSHG